MKDVFIYDAVRTPRGKGRKDGALHEVSALNLATTVLNEIKNRNELDGHAVEDVILGNVTQVGEQGACLARTAVLASDLDEAIPGLAINRFCASGLEAVNLASNQVAGGAGSGIGLAAFGQSPNASWLHDVFVEKLSLHHAGSAGDCGRARGAAAKDVMG